MGQPDAEHPTQGRPLDGRLDWQPPSQLLTLRSILRSSSSTDVFPCGWRCSTGHGATYGVAGNRALLGPLWPATGFGASTVMLGRAWVAELGSVRDIAVPLSNTVDRTARAEGATRLDDILITRSLKSGNAFPGADTVSRIQPAFPQTNDIRVQLSARESRYACATCFDSPR